MELLSRDKLIDGILGDRLFLKQGVYAMRNALDSKPIRIAARLDSHRIRWGRGKSRNDLVGILIRD